MHIVHAIEHKEWPVSVNFSAGEELDISQNEKECSEVITITTDHGVSRSMVSGNNMSASKKRKRHIAIDVETERGNFNSRHSFNLFYNYFLYYSLFIFYYLTHYYLLHSQASRASQQQSSEHTVASTTQQTSSFDQLGD